MELSEKIRIIRKARGFSQEGLGLNLSGISQEGISRQSVSDWENGKSEPRLDNIRDLAKVLDVSFDALLDDSIDLNDPKVLNVVLKHLDVEQKNQVNNSFRYRIHEYNVSRKDYIRVILHLLFIVLGIILTIYGGCNFNVRSYTFYLTIAGSSILLYCLATLSLLVYQIKRIKRGGNSSVFGTLSQSHLVIIGFSDNQYDNTIYVPVSSIERMELGDNKSKKHGVVKVYIKDRNKPLLTGDIVDPSNLIYVFENLDSYIAKTSKWEG